MSKIVRKLLNHLDNEIHTAYSSGSTAEYLDLIDLKSKIYLLNEAGVFDEKYLTAIIAAKEETVMKL